MMCDVQLDNLDLAGDKSDRELHPEFVFMMCDVSSDNISLDNDDYEKLAPCVRIAEHAIGVAAIAEQI